MAFTHKDWKDDPDSSTPLSAAALEDMEDRLAGYTDTTVTAHTGDASAAHAASAISVTPTGGLASTDAQAALAELDTEKQSVSAKGQANGYASLDGSGLVPSAQLPPAQSGSGLPANVLSKTTNFTAAAGDFIEADATSAGLTITLPAAPATGALVSVKKVDGSTNIVGVSASGGGSVDGDSGTPNVAIDTAQAGAIFEHVGSNAWKIVAVMLATGAQGPTGPQGDPGSDAVWTQVTQAEYDALSPADPDTLYIVIG